MIKFFSIYLAFIKQQIKSLIEYKFDFLMGMIALSVQHISIFLILFAVFTQIKTIGSYSFYEILFFYGYSQIVRGIDHVYNDNIWVVGWEKIRDGSFSKYLVRPINAVSHIIFERFQFDGFGEVIIGVFLFIFSKIQLGLVFGIKGWIIFSLFLISGLTIYFAIKLITAAIAFWTVSSGEVMTVVYEVNSFTKYPLDIYKNIFIKNLLIYILPFAVVSYFPMAYFIRDNQFISLVLGINYYNRDFIVLFIMIITLVFLLISLIVWRLGLKRYSATGS